MQRVVEEIKKKLPFQCSELCRNEKIKKLPFLCSESCRRTQNTPCTLPPLDLKQSIFLKFLFQQYSSSIFLMFLFLQLNMQWFTFNITVRDKRSVAVFHSLVHCNLEVLFCLLFTIQNVAILFQYFFFKFINLKFITTS